MSWLRFSYQQTPNYFEVNGQNLETQRKPQTKEINQLRPKPLRIYAKD